MGGEFAARWSSGSPELGRRCQGEATRAPQKHARAGPSSVKDARCLAIRASHLPTSSVRTDWRRGRQALSHSRGHGPRLAADKIVTVTNALTCQWCGCTFGRSSTRGPVPRFCSRSHRQRAYEARRTLPDVVGQLGGGDTLSDLRQSLTGLLANADAITKLSDLSSFQAGLLANADAITKLDWLNALPAEVISIAEASEAEPTDGAPAERSEVELAVVKALLALMLALYLYSVASSLTSVLAGLTVEVSSLLALVDRLVSQHPSLGGVLVISGIRDLVSDASAALRQPRSVKTEEPPNP